MPRFVKGKSRIVRKKVPPAVFPALSRGMVCRSDAKTEKLIAKKWESGTITDHHTLADCLFKKVLNVQLLIVARLPFNQ